MNIFNFKKKAGEVISQDVIFTTPEASLINVAKLMLDGDCGEIPLVRDAQSKNVIGVITDRDIVCRTLAVGKNPMDLKASDCMTTPCITGTIDMTVQECVNLMKENMIRRLPLVDNSGALCGMISQADIARLENDSEAGDFVQKVSRPTGGASEVTH